MYVTVSAGVLPLSHPQPALLPWLHGSLPSSGPAPLLPPNRSVQGGELVLRPPHPSPSRPHK